MMFSSPHTSNTCKQLFFCPISLISSLSVGTKLGYKLYPLTSLEMKLNLSFEKGN